MLRSCFEIFLIVFLFILTYVLIVGFIKSFFVKPKMDNIKSDEDFTSEEKLEILKVIMKIMEDREKNEKNNNEKK